jgi:hypothetical protein
LQDHLPENETNEGDSEEENDETDEVWFMCNLYILNKIL